MGQLGVQPVPGAGPGGAVETCVGDSFGVRGASGVGLPEDEFAAVPGRAAHRVWLARRNSPAQDLVRAHRGEHLDRQVFQQERQAGCVVSGVRDDEDVGVALLPLPGSDQPVEQVLQLPGGDSGGVVPRARRSASKGAVHELRPGSSAQMIEYGQPGTGMCWSLPRP